MSFLYMLFTQINVMKKKRNFGTYFFQILSKISVDEMVMFDADMNGHVGRISKDM